MSNSTTKQCSKCQTVYPNTSDYFPPKCKRKDGSVRLEAQCRNCHNARKRDEYQNNIELHRRTAREQQQTEKSRATRKKYLSEHPDPYRAYRESHRELYQIASKKFRENNPDKTRESQKNYILRHPEYAKAKRKRNYERHYAKNPSYYSSKVAKRRAKMQMIEGSFTQAEITELYEEQGGVCFYCSEPLGNDFHRDHYVPLSRGGTNWIENIVLACEPCNLSKGDKLPTEWKGRFQTA